MSKQKSDPTRAPTLDAARPAGAAAARRGQRVVEALPDAPDGVVCLYALQPEQIPGVRRRLAALGWSSADEIELPHQDRRARQVLAHIVQICARHDHTKRRPGLLYAGVEGLQRLLQLDDARLVKLAAAVARLNQVFANDDERQPPA